MSCELRSYRLRSTTCARSPSSRPPPSPAGTPTTGSPSRGDTRGLTTRSARNATVSPSGSHAAAHLPGRQGAPDPGASRATAASRRHSLRALGRPLRLSRTGSNSTPHRGTTSALITAGHNTGRPGDGVRSMTVTIRSSLAASADTRRSGELWPVVDPHGLGDGRTTPAQRAKAVSVNGSSMLLP